MKSIRAEKPAKSPGFHFNYPGSWFHELPGLSPGFQSPGSITTMHCFAPPFDKVGLYFLFLFENISLITYQFLKLYDMNLLISLIRFIFIGVCLQQDS